jgi:histidinol-phosphate aminotransferase
MLVTGLSALDGVEVFPSEANFVLFRVEHASALWRDLLHEHSVLIRNLARAQGLDDCLRVTVGNEEEVERFLRATEEILAGRRASALFGMQATASRHMEEGE